MNISYFSNLNFTFFHLALAIIGVLLLIQLFYILFVYGKLSLHKVKSFQTMDNTIPLSIIICARNEEENLKTFLPLILGQDYPHFEVIVVNDCSSDDTKWVLQDLERQHGNLKLVEIKEHIQLKHNKKFAVTLGIKAASHEHLLFTDADCQPNSSHWLSEIAGAFSERTEIVLGYSPYFKKKGFLNKLIRFETTHTAMSYLAYALKKNAYMGVGRNMAYRKSLFFKSKGFTSHMHIKSGDDDLFVNQNANRTNVKIAIHPDAHMYSVPKDSWKSYYKQKARHSGASVLYKKKHQRMLGIQLISAALFYISLLTIVSVFPYMWHYVVGAYFIRLITQILVFRPIYKKLAVHDLIWWLPFLDLYYYFYICINGLFNRKKTQRTWK
ncbi:glycosyltransferase [Sphingobacterium sp. SYP-B4668]|uniref:glycosyltransferase n=1 Tax=Sphingobacterium sp. SYP-B4668 TaxID=2996035 RepID=UPI0022DD45B2|nr:glycosyltransferase [Sphingobacterium sp. SYP-B4668]